MTTKKQSKGPAYLKQCQIETTFWQTIQQQWWRQVAKGEFSIQIKANLPYGEK